VGENGEDENGVIVPSKAISELSRMLDGDGKVIIKVSESQIAFELDNILLVSKLIEGKFPDYNQVIPKKSKESVVFLREELLAAIKRASILTSDKSRSVKLIFLQGKMLIEVNSPDIGEYRGEVPLNYKGDEIKMAFNPDFLVNVLRNLNEEEINFEFSDSLNPGVIRSGKSFIYVIMPMRIS